MKLLLVMWPLLVGAYAYIPSTKENILSGIFLRELVNRISGKEDGDVSYLDLTDGMPMDGRSLSRDLEEEQMFPLDYDALGDINLQPSLRDREYLQHSSLWGNQYIAGGAGEGLQRLQPQGLIKNKQEVKTDATLPAYCNPPNPCPVGFTEDQGCITEFENTAAFSRRYQAVQDCMCDSEHMFNCPNNSMDDERLTPVDDLEFTKLMHQLKMGQGIMHKSLVAKKFKPSAKSVADNPFLAGEKLPVAAKKGKKAF